MYCYVNLFHEINFIIIIIIIESSLEKFPQVSHFICSAGEGAGDEQVLQVPDEGGRVGVAPELRDHRPQLQIVSAALHSFRQLRSQVGVLPAGNFLAKGKETLKIRHLCFFFVKLLVNS